MRNKEVIEALRSSYVDNFLALDARAELRQIRIVIKALLGTMTYYNLTLAEIDAMLDKHFLPEKGSKQDFIKNRFKRTEMGQGSILKLFNKKVLKVKNNSTKAIIVRLMGF